MYLRGLQFTNSPNPENVLNEIKHILTYKIYNTTIVLTTKYIFNTFNNNAMNNGQNQI